MKRILKKTGVLIITLWLVSFLSFFAFSVIPGDPATSRLGTEATPEKVEALREEMGLNRPMPVRYFLWIRDFIKGEMGISYSYQMPVGKMIGDKLLITLTLMLLSFVLIILCAIPAGLLSAKYENRWMDQVITVINQVVMSIPPFFLGMLLTFVFGLVLKFFTPGGYVSYKENFSEYLRYMIFPAVAVALPKAAMTVKLLQGSLKEQYTQDYVLTAYSKGNTENAVLYRHVLRNALIPVVTFLAVAMADIVAGSIVIEQVFGIPGLGRLLLSSISNRDYPVVQAIIVIIAFLVVFCNFIADLLYQWLDPRIKLL